MEKILIIGAGDFQLPLIRKASEKYEVLLAAPVVSEKFHPYVSKTLLADVRDKEKILSFARQEGITGVTTDQTDIAVRSVAYVAEQLSLPGIGYETGCLFTDKTKMRARMVERGIPVLPNRKVFSVEEAVDFQTKTGVDALAVAVGTAHGVYKTKPCLQFDRIAELRAAVAAPLVLHGGSGLSDDDFRQAIKCGIAKLNIHTDMVIAGMKAMREQCACHDAAKPATWDYLDTRKAKVAAIKQVVARKLQLFGSVNKA